MKKFIYKMESLLQIKLKLENQAKIAYGNARMKLTAEEEKLMDMQAKKETYEDELRLLGSDKLDLLKIRQCGQAIEVMNMKIKQQKIMVRNANQRLEVVRIRLHDAMVERKTQEKLKEKAFDEYMLEFDSEERKEVDELNSFKYSNPASHEEDI